MFFISLNWNKNILKYTYKPLGTDSILEMDGGGMHYFIYVDSWTVAGYVSMHHLC